MSESKTNGRDNDAVIKRDTEQEFDSWNGWNPEPDENDSIPSEFSGFEELNFWENPFTEDKKEQTEPSDLTDEPNDQNIARQYRKSQNKKKRHSKTAKIPYEDSGLEKHEEPVGKSRIPDIALNVDGIPLSNVRKRQKSKNGNSFSKDNSHMSHDSLRISGQKHENQSQPGLSSNQEDRIQVYGARDAPDLSIQESTWEGTSAYPYRGYHGNNDLPDMDGFYPYQNNPNNQGENKRDTLDQWSTNKEAHIDSLPYSEGNSPSVKKEWFPIREENKDSYSEFWRLHDPGLQKQNNYDSGQSKDGHPRVERRDVQHSGIAIIDTSLAAGKAKEFKGYYPGQTAFDHQNTPDSMEQKYLAYLNFHKDPVFSGGNNEKKQDRITSVQKQFYVAEQLTGEMRKKQEEYETFMNGILPEETVSHTDESKISNLGQVTGQRREEPLYDRSPWSIWMAKASRDAENIVSGNSVDSKIETGKQKLKKDQEIWRQRLNIDRQLFGSSKRKYSSTSPFAGMAGSFSGDSFNNGPEGASGHGGNGWGPPPPKDPGGTNSDFEGDENTYGHSYGYSSGNSRSGNRIRFIQPGTGNGIKFDPKKILVKNLYIIGNTAKVEVMSLSRSDPTLKGTVLVSTVAIEATAPATRTLYHFARRRIAEQMLRKTWDDKIFKESYEGVKIQLEERLREQLKNKLLKSKDKLSAEDIDQINAEIESILSPKKYRDFVKLRKEILKELKRAGLPQNTRSIKKLLKSGKLKSNEQDLLKVYLRIDKLNRKLRKANIPLWTKIRRGSMRMSIKFRILMRKLAYSSDDITLRGAIYSSMVVRRLYKIAVRSARSARKTTKRILKDAKMIRNAGKVMSKTGKSMPKYTIKTGRVVADKIFQGGAYLTKFIYAAGDNLSRKILKAGAKRSAAMTGKYSAKIMKLAARGAARAAAVAAKAAAFIISTVISTIAAFISLLGPAIILIALLLALILGVYAALGIDNEEMEKQEDRAVKQYVDALVKCHEDYAEEIEKLYNDPSYETVTVTYRNEKNEQVYADNPNDYGFMSVDNNIKECLCLMSALFDFDMETSLLDKGEDELKKEDRELMEGFLKKVGLSPDEYDGSYQALIRVYLIALFNGSHSISKRTETEFCSGCVPEYNILGELTNYYCPGHRHLYVTVTTYYFDRLFSCGLRKNPDSVMDINVVGSSNVEKIWFGMINAGFTEEAAAGAIGNLMWESGGGPNDIKANAVESTGEGVGMCQWSFGRKSAFLAFLSSRGESWPSDNILLQLEYMLYELENGQWLWTSIGSEYGSDCNVPLETFRSCTDVEDAVRYFCANFERCHAADAHLDTRIRWAQNVYQMYHGKQQGGFQGTTYTFTDHELKGIAMQCQKEQGTLQGAMAEASLMANRFERYGSSFGTGGSGLFSYVRNSGWFANASYWLDHGEGVDPTILEGVRSVLVDGNRTLPQNIDEHDYMGDISYVSNNGVTFNPYDRSQYIQGVTKIHNQMGATYTFYCFPDVGSDPFGYTWQ